MSDTANARCGILAGHRRVSKSQQTTPWTGLRLVPFFANGNESNTAARLFTQAFKRIALERNNFEGE